MKAVVAAFNQEKALVGAFSVITNLRMDHLEALLPEQEVEVVLDLLRIDESSPLWAVSPETLKSEEFEIILTLEGIVPETGNNIQAGWIN